MSTDGVGGGTSDFIGDYSGAATNGLVKAPAGKTFVVHRFIVFIEDTSGMQAEEYGNLGSALTNGITMTIETAGGDLSTFPAAIKTNAGWAQVGFDADVKSWGAGDEVFVSRITFERFGTSIHLHDDDQIKFVFNDNFTGLIHHTFVFEGTLSQ
jgi:hypothetical protein